MQFSNYKDTVLHTSFPFVWLKVCNVWFENAIWWHPAWHRAHNAQPAAAWYICSTFSACIIMSEWFPYVNFSQPLPGGLCRLSQWLTSTNSEDSHNGMALLMWVVRQCSNLPKPMLKSQLKDMEKVQEKERKSWKLSKDSQQSQCSQLGQWILQARNLMKVCIMLTVKGHLLTAYTAMRSVRSSQVVRI